MRYYVTIIFNSSDEIKLLNDNELHVPLKSKPEFGKANRELIKKLSTFFNISSECIYFISGTKSRKKIRDIKINLVYIFNFMMKSYLQN